LASLQEVTISKEARVIGEDAFYGCENLTTVSFEKGNGLESIGQRAFKYCVSLSSINIPASVRLMGCEAFNGCHSLDNITIGEGINEIKNGVFSECYSLRHLTLPTNLSIIGHWAFADCTELEHIDISNVQEIHHSAFRNCNKLKAVAFSNGITLIGNYAFKGCAELNSVTIPLGARVTIDNGAFYYCSALRTIEIPATAQSIGDHVFAGSGIQEVVFGSSKICGGAPQDDFVTRVMGRVQPLPRVRFRDTESGGCEVY
jgi:hypothetical protein